MGDRLRAEIEQKLDKLQEPPPVKTIKPLPAPIEVARKKRGGRRFGACIFLFVVIVAVASVKASAGLTVGFQCRVAVIFNMMIFFTNRHRKMKERLGITEIRKAQNRMVFGEVCSHCSN